MDESACRSSMNLESRKSSIARMYIIYFLYKNTFSRLMDKLTCNTSNQLQFFIDKYHAFMSAS